jgi:hypothetical protein
VKYTDHNETCDIVDDRSADEHSTHTCLAQSYTLRRTGDDRKRGAQTRSAQGCTDDERLHGVMPKAGVE